MNFYKSPPGVCQFWWSSRDLRCFQRWGRSHKNGERALHHPLKVTPFSSCSKGPSSLQLIIPRSCGRIKNWTCLHRLSTKCCKALNSIHMGQLPPLLWQKYHQLRSNQDLRQNIEGRFWNVHQYRLEVWKIFQRQILWYSPAHSRQSRWCMHRKGLHTAGRKCCCTNGTINLQTLHCKKY